MQWICWKRHPWISSARSISVLFPVADRKNKEVFTIFSYMINSYLHYFLKARSSRPDVFCEKGVLRNFAKFTGKHLYQSQVFSCEFYEIYTNTFFNRTPLVAASRKHWSLLPWDNLLITLSNQDLFDNGNLLLYGSQI